METHPTRPICSLASLVLAAFAVVGTESAVRAGPDLRSTPDEAAEDEVLPANDSAAPARGP